MQHYNKLADVEENNNLTTWHFRVKIIRIHSYYVFGDGSYWSYILVDEDGSTIEMVIYPSNAHRYKGLEKQEGKWVEIFRVEVERAFIGFKPTNFRFKLSAIVGTEIKIITPMNNHHYIEFKSIYKIKHITNIDIPIDTMGVVFNIEPLEVCLEDPIRTKMVFYIRENIENQLKCVATGESAYAFQDGFSNTRGRHEVILVLKMRRILRIGSDDGDIWIETKGGLSNFRFNPCMQEVDEFRQELANSDPYVARYGPIVLV